MRAVDLSEQTGLVMGVANRRSLAWAIAKELHAAGCRLAFTYQNDRLREKVESLVQELGGAPLLECNVSDDEAVDRGFAAAAEALGGHIGLLVHAIAFAPREELEGQFLDTTRDGFRAALDVSAYSFIRAARAQAPYLPPGGGALLTLSYLASERVVPRYNVMGSAKAALEHAVRQLAYELGERNTRVNAISAGPVNTLSARGIAGFNDILGQYRGKAPLRRNIEPEEVGKAALFLLSDLGSGVTGEVLHVDCGYHVMAV